MTNIAGAIMWVPGSIAYCLAAVIAALLSSAAAGRNGGERIPRQSVRPGIRGFSSTTPRFAQDRLLANDQVRRLLSSPSGSAGAALARQRFSLQSYRDGRLVRTTLPHLNAAGVFALDSARIFTVLALFNRGNFFLCCLLFHIRSR